MLIKERYYCTDVANCRLARQSYVYSKQDFLQNEGVCRGSEGEPCGKPLKAGSSQNRILAFSLAILAGALVVFYALPAAYNIIVPPPLAGYAFIEESTEVSELDATASIRISRTHTSKAETIEFTITESTALLGEDFIVPQTEIFFAEGEREATIKILITEDNDFRERRESFTVGLLNVEGNAVHPVTIIDPPLPEDQITKATALVRHVSVIAADLAKYSHRDGALRRFIRGLPPDSKRIDEFIQDFDINQENILRTREEYALALHNMKDLDRLTVLLSIDERIASLEREYGDSQQIRATRIMKQHFERYSETSIPESNVWQNELEDSIESGERDDAIINENRTKDRETT